MLKKSTGGIGATHGEELNTREMVGDKYIGEEATEVLPCWCTGKFDGVVRTLKGSQNVKWQIRKGRKMSNCGRGRELADTENGRKSQSVESNR